MKRENKKAKEILEQATDIKKWKSKTLESDIIAAMENYVKFKNENASL